MGEGMDLGSYLRFLAALGFVLGLIGLLAWVMRRYGGGFGVVSRHSGVRRLRVTEVLPIDNRRRLVLVRRDGREHLLLLGHQDDLVVERDIEPDPEALAESPRENGRPAGGGFGALVERIRRQG